MELNGIETQDINQKHVKVKAVEKDEKMGACERKLRG